MNGKDFLPIEWVGRSNSRNSKADVTIKLVHNSDTRPCINITLRNNVKNKITDTEYVEVGIYKNRIFFRSAGSVSGLLCANNKTTTNENYYVRLNGEVVNSFLPFVGDYDLKFEECFDLYYIEKKGE